MVVAIVQARTSSNRLPGKVLKLISGKPMLQLQLERLSACKKIDKIVVATSVDPSDDPLEDLVVSLGIPCFRGNLNDVLDRYYQAAKKYEARHVVRITGDCPLLDPSLIDQLVENYFTGGYDYYCNTQEPTFPDGLDSWIFSFPSLEKAWKEATLPSEREHVVMYMKMRPQTFKIGSFLHQKNLSHLRWTVDEQADFKLVERIYQELYPLDPLFGLEKILVLLEKYPELKVMNQHFERDAGLAKSQKEDEKWVSRVAARTIDRSLQMQEKATKLIPGMNQLLSKRPDQFSAGVWPGYYKKAKGVDVWDLDDNRYIDMSIGGIGATVLGYANDEVDEAVRAAVSAGVSSSLNCVEEVDLAELLCRHHPWAEQVRFARTGGEAMTLAVRIARAATGREKIAFCGYHGWHDWYLAANLGTENALGEHLLPGLNPHGVPISLAGTALPFQFNRLDQLEEILAAHPGEVAAIVMEPIRNNTPKETFLEGVRALAEKTGAILVFDEISAGYRLQIGGSHLGFGTTPDIAVFAKAIGNGYAMAAVIGKRSVMENAQKSFISSTCWTERVGPAATLSTLRFFEKNHVHQHLIRTGELIQAGWSSLAEKNGIGIHVGGIAPLSHFTFENKNHLALKAFFVQNMLDRGFLASNIFYAMYSHQEWHVKAYLEATDLAFAEIAQVLDSAPEALEDKVLSKLRGKPAASGFKRLN